MAVQSNIGLMPMAFKADEALDDYQYYCVYAASTAGYVARATGASAPHPIGVLQDNAASARGEAVAVAMFGPCIAKVAACGLANEACPIKVGDFLTVNTDGILNRAGSVGDLVSAMALEAITSSCYIANIHVFWYGVPGASATESS